MKITLLAFLFFAVADAASAGTFKLAPHPELPGCDVLFEGDRVVVRTSRGRRNIFAMGKCAKSLPSDEGVNIWVHKSISIDPRGDYAKALGFPDKKTGLISKIVVRRWSQAFGPRRQQEKYVYFFSKTR